ncbi:helix-turn-helix transcriptional regulator [uncultured Draconibacterium sp.]|uniref:helix-turn-helix domain-containing protein n=1 Tax=uncultured Draconibacterium sp. TaxID=1573823 RepID=UPI0025CD23BA|nr:helix-turn-helix transcriptional regulator [uncultured Draconibacterium sp.]
MVVEAFAKVLRAEREKKKLSQEKLAELCDLDRTYISLLERGLRQPTLTTIFRISKSLGIVPSKLIEQVEKEMK